MIKKIPAINMDDIPEFANDKQIEMIKNQCDTFINNWTPDLIALKTPSFLHHFDISDFACFFIASAYGDIEYEGQEFKEKREKFISRIKPAFTKSAFNNLFVRLNRRSPKDNKIHVHTPEETFDALLGSMRSIDDVSFLRYHKQPIFIYFCVYDQSVSQKEFRCFVKDKKMIAITQYEGTKIKGYPEDSIKDVYDKITTLSTKVIPAAKLDDFVFDCFFIKDKCYFLEINPYGLSDPCFFINYENVEKGGFAYQKTNISYFKDITK